jgi:hypothetical protein
MEIVVRTEDQTILSADGQVEVALRDGDKIIIRTSPLVTRFVSMQEPSCFYRNLTSCRSRNPSAKKRSDRPNYSEDPAVRICAGRVPIMKRRILGRFPGW